VAENTSAPAESPREGYASRNRRAKRDQIIDAAKEVLAREGLAACTARAVADASPLTKSAIHYYFNDINEIVDQAVLAHLDAMLESLHEQANRITNPDERLWAAINAYLATFADKPHAAFLWFEYWISASRRNSLDTVDHMLGKVHAFLLDLLNDLAPNNPDETAHALLSWLLGTVVQQHVHPRPAAALRHEIDAIVRGPADS
jgi:AcrR family transcriptional regulator